MSAKTDSFLKRFGMHISQIDDARFLSEFQAEMRAGLKGEETSLGMVSSYTDLHKNIEPCKVTAIDAGGTNLRIAQIAIGFSDQPEIETMQTHPMLGTSGSLSKQEFFFTLADLVLPLVRKTGLLGVSFAFPGTITSDKDMIIGSMAKEILIENIDGESMRQNLNDAFMKLSGRRYDIRMVNDGVASLLGAAPLRLFNACDALIGTIIGTGTNICYKERCENILKNEYPSDMREDIVNIESGCFSKYTGGQFDHLLDERSLKPKDHVFEKMIGGKYLGELLMIACKTAVDEGLISSAYNSNLIFKDAKDVAAIIDSSPFDDDSAVIRDLAVHIMRRAGRLAALSIASPILLNEKNTKTAYIAFEGSTILKTPLLMEELKRCLSALLGRIAFETSSAPNSVLKGTALSVLLHHS